MTATSTRTRKLVIIAMLSAIGWLLASFAQIPIVPAVGFLRYEPKDVVLTIAGFIYGPAAPFVMALIISLVEMFTTSVSGPIGAIMNFISSCAFACTAAFIYKVVWVEWVTEKKTCSSCGEVHDAGMDFLNLPKKFWMTFAGAAGVLFFTLFNWIRIYTPDGTLSINLFSFIGRTGEMSRQLGFVGERAEEFARFRGVMTVMLALMVVAIVSLVVSLVFYKSKHRAKLAYLGFGLSALVSAGFFAYGISTVEDIVKSVPELASGGLARSGLTIFPLKCLVCSIVAMLILVKRPAMITNMVGIEGSGRRRKRTIARALIGLAVGVIITTSVMMLWNYFLSPFFMGVPRAAVVRLLIPGFLPFNLIKYTLNAGIVLLIYKPIRIGLSKSGLIPASETAAVKTSKVNLGVLIVAAFVVITCVFFVLSFRGVI